MHIFPFSHISSRVDKNLYDQLLQYNENENENNLYDENKNILSKNIQPF